jgi:hypothetical protein
MSYTRLLFMTLAFMSTIGLPLQDSKPCEYLFYHHVPTVCVLNDVLGLNISGDFNGGSWWTKILWRGSMSEFLQFWPVSHHYTIAPLSATTVRKRTQYPSLHPLSVHNPILHHYKKIPYIKKMKSKTHKALLANTNFINPWLCLLNLSLKHTPTVLP